MSALAPSWHRFVRACSLASLYGALGCQPPPAFEMRWTIDRTQRPDFADEGIVPLTNPAQCSRVGVDRLQVLTYAADGEVGARELVSILETACFPRQFFDDEDALYPGPSVSAGDYVVAIRGVSGSPSRMPWVENDAALLPECTDATISDPFVCQPCDATGSSCLMGFDACDCQTVRANDRDPPAITEFVLSAPHECDDGVDNDDDGLVDRDDPGCMPTAACDVPGLECPLSESLGSRRNSLQLAVRLLGMPEEDTPAGACVDVNLDAYDLSLRRDGQTLWQARVPCDAASVADRSMTLDIPPGDTTLHALGLDASGAARTLEQTIPVTIGAGPNPVELELWGQDFVEPIVAPTILSMCEGTDPRVDGAQVRIVGPRRTDAGVRDADGNPLDGTLRPCAPLTTEPLTWGTFAVEAVLLAGDTPCFDNLQAPPLLWPRATMPIFAPHATRAEGCPTCLYDLHCGPNEACVAGECSTL